MIQATSSGGHVGYYANMGAGPSFSFIDIGIADKIVAIEANSAFWSIVSLDAIPGILGKNFSEQFIPMLNSSLLNEMHQLRHGITPSAAYINPTERCNFNCDYCYLPEDIRLSGKSMSTEELIETLDILDKEFTTSPTKSSAVSSNSLPARPKIIFHGSEPLLVRDSIFTAIEHFHQRFDFGIQTNATLLDDSAIKFLRKYKVGIGISLDAPDEITANASRKNWQGEGAFTKIVKVLDLLSDYPAFNVITTITQKNVNHLVEMVEFLHAKGVRTAMLNPVRCTRNSDKEIMPDEEQL
ncbi:MAG: radical SAM protein, partial [Oligoflexia bacterium]|nr:radical SAM protein [Oligoflexia bacterium]